MSLKFDHREDFKDHKVTVLVNTPEIQAFNCSKPESNIFAFRIVITDNCIAMNGDIGEIMICPGYNRGIRWLRGAIDSVHYVLEKVPYNFRTKEWNEKEAAKSMQSMIDEEESEKHKAAYQEIKEGIENETIYSSESFYSEWNETELGEAPDEMETLTRRTWIQLSAITWLTEWMDATGFKVARRRWKITWWNF